MRQGRKGKGWLPNPETGLAGSVGQNREKPRRNVAEQDGKKEPDLPQTDLLWARATAVAERAVSPPELRRCTDRCARRDGLGKQGRLQAESALGGWSKHPEVPGGLVRPLGHVEIFQMLES